MGCGDLTEYPLDGDLIKDKGTRNAMDNIVEDPIPNVSARERHVFGYRRKR